MWILAETLDKIVFFSNDDFDLKLKKIIEIMLTPFYGKKLKFDLK